MVNRKARNTQTANGAKMHKGPKTDKMPRARKKPKADKKAPPAPPASNAAVRASMQGNKGANTKPELVLRNRLRESGLTGYRLHWKAPGKPDVAWPGKKVCVFVNGCFWHRHEGCKMASTPKTNVEYWTFKFERNVERDTENLAALEAQGWTVHVVWECQLKTNTIEDTLAQLLPQLSQELDKPLAGRGNQPR